MNRSFVALIGWEEGGAGQIDSWFEQETGQAIACFVNPSDEPIQVEVTKQRDSKKFSYPTKDSFKGRPLINSSRWTKELLDRGIKKILICLSDKNKQEECFRMGHQSGFEILSAIHPSAIILPESQIGQGVTIHAGAVIGYKAEIHDGVIINTGAQVDHHSIVEEFAVLDPGVLLAGNVTVRRKAHVHTGAVIINKVRIGEYSILGAGTVVIEDVPDAVTVVGVPGKIVKRHERAESLRRVS